MLFTCDEVTRQKSWPTRPVILITTAFCVELAEASSLLGSPNIYVGAELGEMTALLTSP